MAITTFKVGDVTIHRVVEQEGPFFDPLEFFPTLTAAVKAFRDETGVEWE